MTRMLSYVIKEKPKNQCITLFPKSMIGNGVKVSIQSLRLQLKDYGDEQAVNLSLDEFAGMHRITLLIKNEKGESKTTDVVNVCLHSKVSVETSIRELFQIERWLNMHLKDKIVLHFEKDKLILKARPKECPYWNR